MEQNNHKKNILTIPRYIKITKKIFLLCIVLFIITGIFYGDYRSVPFENISEEIFPDPIQEPIDKPSITKTVGGYDYQIDFLYSYNISSLLVSKNDYTKWNNGTEISEIFTTDLCVLWGENIKNLSYKSDQVRFSQNMRFCWYYIVDGLQEKYLSNIHVIPEDKKILSKIKKIHEGDQFQLQGYLVNISALSVIPRLQGYENFLWNSSITREDTGAGACETLYVTDVKIIKKHRTIIRHIHDTLPKIIFFLFFLQVFLIFLKGKETYNPKFSRDEEKNTFGVEKK